MKALQRFTIGNYEKISNWQKLPRLIISLDWLKIKISSSYGNFEAVTSSLYSAPHCSKTFCSVVKLIEVWPRISEGNKVPLIQSCARMKSVPFGPKIVHELNKVVPGLSFESHTVSPEAGSTPRRQLPKMISSPNVKRKHVLEKVLKRCYLDHFERILFSITLLSKGYANFDIFLGAVFLQILLCRPLLLQHDIGFQQNCKFYESSVLFLKRLLLHILRRK